MTVSETLVANGLVVTEGGPTRAHIAIQNGRIVGMLGDEASIEARETIDATGKIVLPGVIDAHVHVRTVHSLAAETVETASVAGAYGGVTSFLYFIAPAQAVGAGPESAVYPGLQTSGVDVEEFFGRVIAEGRQSSVIDFGIHCMLLPDPDIVARIDALMGMGISSFKLMMAYGRRGWVSDDQVLALAMEAIADRGGLAMVHAENDGLIRHLEEKHKGRGDYAPGTFLATRPNRAEAEAVHRAMQIAGAVGCPLYIVHLSAREALEQVVRGKEQGQPVFAETCPQYLLLTEMDTRRLGGLVKMAPPLRSKEDNDALWRGIQHGFVEIVSTDHAAFHVEKQKQSAASFAEVPYGMPGIETLLPLMYSEGVAKGRISLEQLVDLLCTRPARRFGLYPQKGAIRIGADADLVLLDPNAEWEIRRDNLHTAAGYSPFEGWRVRGRPVRSLLRGKTLLKNGTLQQRAGFGQYLDRSGKQG
jgi:dihydropyrimidinase